MLTSSGLFRRGWLASHRDNTNHFVGVGLFCMGSSMYSIAFLWLAGQTHKHLWKIHQGLASFLFVSSVAQVFAFMVLWILEDTSGQHMPHIGDSKDGVSGDNNTQTAYIVEHSAYMTQLLFYATFILFHSPDQEFSERARRGKNSNGDNEQIGVAMLPLLHPSGFIGVNGGV